MELVRLIGILGLIAVTAGVLARQTMRRNAAFVVGGITLLFYSLAIGDGIFALLQLIFTVSAGYELWREQRRN